MIKNCRVFWQDTWLGRAAGYRRWRL